MGMTKMPPLGASGLPASLNRVDTKTVEHVAQALETKPRLPVIWLEFQDCTGCSEALTRANAPTLSNLVLNTLTIEHHEALSAASGFQVEEAKQQAMKKYAGQYILEMDTNLQETCSTSRWVSRAPYWRFTNQTPKRITAPPSVETQVIGSAKIAAATTTAMSGSR